MSCHGELHSSGCKENNTERESQALVGASLGVALVLCCCVCAGAVVLLVWCGVVWCGVVWCWCAGVVLVLVLVFCWCGVGVGMYQVLLHVHVLWFDEACFGASFSHDADGSGNREQR